MSNDEFNDLIEMPDGTYRIITKPSITHTSRQALYRPTDRKVKKTPSAMDRVLEVLRDGGSITDACNAVNIKPSTLRYWRINDKQFDVACQDAMDCYTDILEKEVYHRALNGVQQEVFHDGEQVGTKTIHDNNLLVKALSARRPDLWGTSNKKLEVSGSINSQTTLITIDFTKSLEELAKYGHSELTSQYKNMLENDRKLLENKK